MLYELKFDNQNTAAEIANELKALNICAMTRGETIYMYSYGGYALAVENEGILILVWDNSDYAAVMNIAGIQNAKVRFANPNRTIIDVNGPCLAIRYV